MKDPYILDHQNIKDPPTGFFRKLKHLGPGFILSASVVGSGELISTTTLGAKAGFTTFWVILISCMVKVALQLEFGKQSIRTGETVMMSLNKLPGPRWGKRKVHWSLWSWLYLWAFKLLQLGGIIGGVAISLHLIIPALPVAGYAVITAVIVAAMVFKGYYSFIETMSVLLMALFTVFTIMAVFFLQSTPHAINLDQVLEGLTFNLPAGTVGFAIAAFGLTGVGGDEIVAYNYWCLEKGYARYTGPFENTKAWYNRAKGWVKVMYLDAILSMVVYTLVTAAFYLLGAAVLNKRGALPSGFDMIETLSLMYTDSYGPWAKMVFLIGSFVVLFSTLFSGLAARTRIFPDLFGQVGWIDFFDMKQRKKVIAWSAWILPGLWLIALLFIKLPVIMVTIGGIVTFIMLLIIVFGGLHFRFYRNQFGLPPGKFYDIALLLSAIAIVLVGVYSIYRLF